MAKKSHKLELVIDAKNRAGATLDKTSDQVGAIGAAARVANEELGILDTTLLEVGFALSSLAAISGAFVASLYSIAGDFEQSMASVKAITGATGEEFDSLTKKALELGTTTRFTATEAAEGMKFLGMAGMNTAQIVSAVGPALDLATVSGMDLARSADILSNIMTGFGLAAEQASVAANTLAVVAANANTNIEQMGEAMSYAATSAAAAGVSLETAAAAVGVLGDAGIQASMAGTSLRGILTALAKPTKEAKDQLSELGVEIAYQADGSIDLVGTLGRLKDANVGLSEATSIFNRRTAASVLALTANLDKLKALEYQTQSNSKALEQMRAVMEQTFQASLTRLSSAIDGFMITLGQHILRTTTAIIDAVASIISSVTALAQAFPNLTYAIANFLDFVVLIPAIVTGLVAVFWTLFALVGLLIKRTILKTTVDALEARGIQATTMAIYGEIKARASNLLATVRETVGITANTAAKEANTVASGAAGAAAVASSAKAAKTASDWGLLGMAAIGVKDTLKGLWSVLAKAGSFLKAQGVFGLIAAAARGLWAALTLLVGAAGAVVTSLAVLGGGIALFLTRELTGAGALIREHERNIERFSKTAEDAGERLKDLQKEFVDASGKVRQVRFHNRDLADLSKMDSSEVERYADQLTEARKKAQAELYLIFQLMSDPGKSDDEIKQLKAKAKQATNVLKALDNSRRALQQYDRGMRALKPEEAVRKEKDATAELIEMIREKNQLVLDLTRAEYQEKEHLLDQELAAQKAALAEKYTSEAQTQAATETLLQSHAAKRLAIIQEEYQLTKRLREQAFHEEQALLNKSIAAIRKELANKKITGEERRKIEKELAESTKELRKLEREYTSQQIEDTKRATDQIAQDLSKQLEKRAEFTDKLQALQEKIRDTETDTAAALRQVQATAASEYEAFEMKLEDVRSTLQSATDLMPDYPEKAIQLAQQARSQFASLAQDVDGLRQNLKTNQELIADALREIENQGLKGTDKWKAELREVMIVLERARAAASEGRAKEAEQLYREVVAKSKQLASSAPDKEKKKAKETATGLIEEAGKELLELNRKSIDEAKDVNKEVAAGIEETGRIITEEVQRQIDAVEKNISALDRNTAALQRAFTGTTQERRPQEQAARQSASGTKERNALAEQVEGRDWEKVAETADIFRPASDTLRDVERRFKRLGLETDTDSKRVTAGMRPQTAPPETPQTERPTATQGTLGGIITVAGEALKPVGAAARSLVTPLLQSSGADADVVSQLGRGIKDVDIMGVGRIGGGMAAPPSMDAEIRDMDATESFRGHLDSLLGAITSSAARTAGGMSGLVQRAADAPAPGMRKAKAEDTETPEGEKAEKGGIMEAAKTMMAAAQTILQAAETYDGSTVTVKTQGAWDAT